MPIIARREAEKVHWLPSPLVQAGTADTHLGHSIAASVRTALSMHSLALAYPARHHSLLPFPLVLTGLRPGPTEGWHAHAEPRTQQQESQTEAKVPPGHLTGYLRIAGASDLPTLSSFARALAACWAISADASFRPACSEVLVLFYTRNPEEVILSPAQRLPHVPGVWRRAGRPPPRAASGGPRR